MPILVPPFLTINVLITKPDIVIRFRSKKPETSDVFNVLLASNAFSRSVNGWSIFNAPCCFTISHSTFQLPNFKLEITNCTKLQKSARTLAKPLALETLRKLVLWVLLRFLFLYIFPQNFQEATLKGIIGGLASMKN